jgi:MFS transporter, Spinster family, sphingosine-1-phosphate transporter
MRLVAFLWVAFALNYIDRQMVYSMFPALQRDLGFAAARLGLIGAVFLWVYTLGMAPAGRLADLWRRDGLITGSLAAWSLATAGCGFATSEWSFLFWRGVMGLTESLYYPTALAMIASHYPEAMRSRALGVHQSGQLVGVVAGGWFGGWAADHAGWREAFWAAGFAGAVYCGILWWGIRGLGVEVRKPAAPASWIAVRELFRNPGYVALSATFAGFCAMQWIFFAWFPTFLQERFSLSMTSSGWNGTLFVQASGILGILAGGALADRLRRKWQGARLFTAAAGVLLCAPFAYLTFSAESLWIARLCSAAFGVFGGLLAANAFSGAYDLTGEANRGLAGGILNGIGGLASGAMIYVTGILKDTIGFGGMMVWMMLAAMACSLALIAAVWVLQPGSSDSRLRPSG